MRTRLIYVGLTHRSAPLDVRERLTPDRARIPMLLDRLADAASERILLSTCGRFELYAISEDDGDSTWVRRFAALTGRTNEEVGPFVTVRRGGEAARHLLQVAAGLDSQIVGEDHVITQVRGAFAEALSAGCCGPVLSALLRAAIRTGKRVRSETAINRIPASFASLALERLCARTDPSALGSVLIVGSGRMAREVAVGLMAARSNAAGGACPRQPYDWRPDTVIAARNLERAGLIAAEIGGRAVPMERLPHELAVAGTVFACTSSSRCLITAAGLACRQPVLHVVDLGMPRNVDPAAGRLPGVDLSHLDDLAPASAVQTEVLEAADAIVQEEHTRFERWLRGRAVAPLVTRLARLVQGCEPQAARELKRRLHGRIMRLKEGNAA